jgi:hypothetical protein
MNSSAEAKFEEELEVFRRDCEAAAQFLFAHLAINEAAGRSLRVLALLNEHPLFWNTVAGALQQSAFIALGRVFETKSPHNLGALIRLVQDNRDMFTRAALARRKQAGRPEPPPWLEEFMHGVRDPQLHTFRALRREVHRYRQIYEARYGAIRDKVVAHSEVVEHESIGRLFG